MKPPFTDGAIPQHVLEAMSCETPDMRMGGNYNLSGVCKDLRGINVLEADPSGKSPNEAGAKLDAGKVMPSLIIEGMARAIWGIAEVATFGANKYSRDGWMAVQDGQYRYANAGYRHLLKRAMGERIDPDSQLEHLKQEAWNAMAKLDLYMREQETLVITTTKSY